MPEFHQTGYGRRFFEQQLPDLIAAIRELAAQTARQNVLMERHIELLERQEAVEAPDLSWINPAGERKDQDGNRIISGPQPLVIPNYALVAGDPILVKSKLHTGRDVQQAWVLKNDPENEQITVEFETSPHELPLADAVLPYRYIEHDPYRQNRNGIRRG